MNQSHNNIFLFLFINQLRNQEKIYHQARYYFIVFYLHGNYTYNVVKTLWLDGRLSRKLRVSSSRNDHA